MPTTRPLIRLRTLALTIFLLAGLTIGVQAAPASAEIGSPACTMYVSPSGSDKGSGSSEQPFATVQHLANSLSAGQTGCLRGGVFNEDVKVEHGGNSSAPLTITSAPGERATLVGRLWVPQGSDYVTVENLNLNGRNSASLPSPTVNGNFAHFLGNDVTNEHTEICFVVGSTWGRANHTLIQGNRIHDCGMIPSRNQDHGIYVDEADNTEILDNVIYKNTDRGVQLYPDAQGTVVERNIIDSNGEGVFFSGASGHASSNTTVQDNLITNSQIRYDIESWYPSGNPIGQNNTAQNNCVWGGAYGTIEASKTGFQTINNITANPGYANPNQGDYRVNSTSPCAKLLSTTIPTQPFTTTSTTTYVGVAEVLAQSSTIKKTHHRATAAAARAKKKKKKKKAHGAKHKKRHHKAHNTKRHHKAHKTSRRHHVLPEQPNKNAVRR